MARNDDFATRRQGLVDLSDKQLEERFWQLTQQVVDPMLELARTHTSPSIERSVLLRMGFSSLETQALVEKCVENQLLGKGAGHVVWRLAQLKGMGVREAGIALAQGQHWTEVKECFAGGAAR